MAKSIRTPGARVRGLGAAGEGTGHFLLQRMTAASNILLILFFIGLVVALAGEDYLTVVAILERPLVAIPFLLAIVSVTLHMRVGMQVIIEDYVHTEGLKILAVIGNNFFAAAIALAAVFSILKISFGG
ncbi:succinate dehydrogenase, hydrophobic membrane anchor protein [Lutibaculum baratangense]|uniref:Succinate dehydrogenase hydrophobic membrane anchor subunit n=1 Tax=Lutibaculum baratangense AMV1 TaxID=631454 RepID=V4R3G8_9HYPH|nr:succinate dehydrogenase, hydrophobic membrane anchor protein [Lutibaculum baratangense]ESR26477.1 Succinate dehydrogenase hydrophobic membrane anchor protein [Lutibaculum baratangense AMV1]